VTQYLVKVPNNGRVGPAVVVVRLAHAILVRRDVEIDGEPDVALAEDAVQLLGAEKAVGVVGNVASELQRLRFPDRPARAEAW